MSSEHNLIIPIEASIGSIDAENDTKFLDEAFVDHPAMTSLIDPESSKMVLVGRTGSGKSAILLQIKKRYPNNSHRIETNDVAMEHLYNTSIISWLTQNNFSIDKFLDVIWNHVFLTTIIKARFDNETILERTFTQNSERSLLQKYIKQHASTVFENIEIDSGEIARSIGGDLNASLSPIIGSNVNSGMAINVDEKFAIQKKLTEAVPSALLRHQAKCKKILQSQKFNIKDQLYIIIDDLDSDIGNLELQKQLISSLFRVCKSYAGFSGLQFCISIREDLFRLVSRDFPNGQNFYEKFADKVIHLEWRDNLLIEMIEKRINLLFRYQYTGRKIGFGDVFKNNVFGEYSPMEYILDRTMRRPRDVIQFVNACLDLAKERNEVTSAIITSAEMSYSSERLQWLIQEWLLLKPQCRFLLDCLREFDATFKFKKLKSLMFDDEWLVDLLEIFEHHQDSNGCKVCEAAYGKSVDDEAFDKFAIMCVRDFVLMGVLEIHESGAWLTAFHTHLDLSKLDDNAKLRVSPMLNRALELDTTQA